MTVTVFQVHAGTKIHADSRCMSYRRWQKSAVPLEVVAGDIDLERVCRICAEPLIQILECWANVQDLDDDPVVLELRKDNAFPIDRPWRQVILASLRGRKMYRFQSNHLDTDLFVVVPRRFGTAVDQFCNRVGNPVDRQRLSCWELPEGLNDETYDLAAALTGNARRDAAPHHVPWHEADGLAYVPNALLASSLLTADAA